MSGSYQARPVVLTIGGSDSCGGAGIQADLRVFEALHVHGCSATTALTAQHPEAVIRIEPVSLAQLDAEMHAVFDYYDVAVVKTGMLVDAEHIALVSALLSELHQGALVIDPVMVSSSGVVLLDAGAIGALTQALFPVATLITPNQEEADFLFGLHGDISATEMASMVDQVGCAVLLKGGHSNEALLVDRLCERDGTPHEFSHPRQIWDLEQRHGTGCRLASAISANLAHAMPLPEAVEQAIHYLQC